MVVLADWTYDEVASAYVATDRGFRFEVREEDGDWSYAYIGPYDVGDFDHHYDFSSKEEAMAAAGEVSKEIGYEI